MNHKLVPLPTVFDLFTERTVASLHLCLRDRMLHQVAKEHMSACDGARAFARQPSEAMLHHMQLVRNLHVW